MLWKGELLSVITRYNAGRFKDEHRLEILRNYQSDNFVILGDTVDNISCEIHPFNEEETCLIARSTSNSYFSFINLDPVSVLKELSGIDLVDMIQCINKMGCWWNNLVTSLNLMRVLRGESESDFLIDQTVSGNIDLDKPDKRFYLNVQAGINKKSGLWVSISSSMGGTRIESYNVRKFDCIEDKLDFMYNSDINPKLFTNLNLTDKYLRISRKDICRKDIKLLDPIPQSLLNEVLI